MSIYTFYPCAADGLASTFQAFDLPSDEAAADRARRMLDEHLSCASVVVWAAERRVSVHRREDRAA